MGTNIVKTPGEIAKLIDRKSIGRSARGLRVSDLSPALIKEPKTIHEAHLRVKRMKRIGYLVPVDEAFSFADEDYTAMDYDTERSAQEIFDHINNGGW